MFRRADKKRIRYAVVGAGNIAQVAVLPAFVHTHENSELAAIVSNDPLKRAALGKRYRVATGSYDELETLIERERIEALYLALPNQLHRSFTERAVRTKVHVLCEKPMAMRSEDCVAMIDACEAADLRLMIAYRLHFDEANLRAIAIVRAGRIGEPRYFSAEFSQQVRPGNIRTRAATGGGALFDLGIYCVNAARFLFQAEPITVLGQQATSMTDERFGAVDEMTTGVLRFPGTRFAQFTASQGAADMDSLRIVGTEGELRLEPAFGYASDPLLSVKVAGKTEQKRFRVGDQFGPEILYFSDCILRRVRPEPSGMEGLADVRVLEAIARSARTGARVSLDPFDPGARPGLSQRIRKPAVPAPPLVRAPSPSR